MKHLKVFVLVAGFLCAAVFYLMTEKRTEEVVLLTEAGGEGPAAGGMQEPVPQQTLPSVQVICSCACAEAGSKSVSAARGQESENGAASVAGAVPPETAPFATQPAESPSPAQNSAQTTSPVQEITAPPVPAQETAAPEENSAAQGQGLINLNTADKTQLMELPGIGESKADAILRYREEYGPFAHIEEIMNISGIKTAAFEKIKDQITVS